MCARWLMSVDGLRASQSVAELGTPDGLARLSAAPLSEGMQPVVSFMTHALTVHGNRMSKLKAHMAEVVAGASRQAEELTHLRGVVERQQIDAGARIRRAEEAASLLVATATARAESAEGANSMLEQRIARLEELPRLVEGNRDRIDQLELARTQHSHELIARCAESAEAREALMQLRSRVDGCVEIARVDTLEAATRAAQSQVRQDTEATTQGMRHAIDDVEQKLGGGLGKLGGALGELQSSVGVVNRDLTELANKLGSRVDAALAQTSALHRSHGNMAQALAHEQAQLQLQAQAQAQLISSLQPAQAEAAGRITTMVGDMDGFQRRISRTEIEQDTLHRRTETVAEELRSEIALLLKAQKSAQVATVQKASTHVKALGSEFLRELKSKVELDDAQRMVRWMVGIGEGVARAVVCRPLGSARW